jgi:hypothetical protein
MTGNVILIRLAWAFPVNQDERHGPAAVASARDLESHMATRSRSSVSDKFVKKSFAKSHPNTTENERVKPSSPRKPKGK